MKFRVAWNAAKLTTMIMNGATRLNGIVVKRLIGRANNKQLPAPSTFARASDQMIV